MATPDKRPQLTSKLDAKTFGKWYWEVKELGAFLRSEGLPSSGLKADLSLDPIPLLACRVA